MDISLLFIIINKMFENNNLKHFFVKKGLLHLKKKWLVKN